MKYLTRRKRCIPPVSLHYSSLTNEHIYPARIKIYTRVIHQLDIRTPIPGGIGREY